MNDVIWKATDNQGVYRVECVRKNDRHGELRLIALKDHSIVRAEVVPLAYGAIFGPDYADVAAWGEQITAWMKELEDG